MHAQKHNQVGKNKTSRKPNKHNKTQVMMMDKAFNHFQHITLSLEHHQCTSNHKIILFLPPLIRSIPF